MTDTIFHDFDLYTCGWNMTYTHLSFSDCAIQYGQKIAEFSTWFQSLWMGGKLVLLRFSKSGKRTVSDGFVKKSADSDSVSNSRRRHYKLIYTDHQTQRLSTGGRQTRRRTHVVPGQVWADKWTGREAVIRSAAAPRRVCLNLSQGHYTHYWRTHTALYRHLL